MRCQQAQAWLTYSQVRVAFQEEGVLLQCLHLPRHETRRR